MTEEEARKILTKSRFLDHDELSCGVPWVGNREADSIELDGRFIPEELEAIAWWLKNTWWLKNKAEK